MNPSTSSEWSSGGQVYNLDTLDGAASARLGSKLASIFGDTLRRVEIIGYNIVLFHTVDKKTYTLDNKSYSKALLGREGGLLAEIVELRGEELADVSSSGSHALARTVCNKIYGWGSNNKKRLVDSKQEDIRKPLLLYADARDIKMFKCFADFTILLRNGQIIIKGDRNAWFPFGNVYPLAVAPENRIEYITCGRYHLFAVNASGEALGFGSEDNSALGNASATQSLSLKGSNSRLASIACGDRHSVALTKNGDVFMFGNLGNPRETKVPRKFSFGNVIVEQIEMLRYWGGTIAKSIQGTCYVSKQEFLECSPPQPIATPFKCVKQAQAFYGDQSAPFMMDRNPRGTSILNNIARMFNNPELSDIEFVLGTTTVYAHTFVLKLNCNYMNVITGHGETSKQIVVSGYKFRSFFAYLFFVYHEHLLDLAIIFVIELIRLARDFNEPVLMDACVARLQKMINIQNACKLYNLSIEYGLATLQTEVSKFIRDNIHSIAGQPDFQSFDPNSFKQIMSLVRL